ncbi:MAG TPA: polysaccharide biosynthesis/export family protein [Thermoanaerobaculia bacterium]|nr:polysaccharide biosynthesis/export family protein [Thermoanaerobaculia bacterium]
MMKTRFAFILILSCGVLTGTLSAQGVSPPDTDYQIGPRDLLQIRVFQDPSLNTEARVGQDGSVRMPLLTAVPVGGLTATQAGERIKELLEARYMNKADVSVVIREFESKPISVFGAVSKPGKIQIGGDMTLIQAISAAGGLSSASAKNIYVLRTARNGLTSQIVIDAEELMVRGNSDLNIPVEPNDVINVLADRTLTIYLFGEVMRPGVVQFRESQNPTLVQALAAAGGLTDRASRGTIIIKRANGEADEKVNLRRILAGTSEDFLLKDNDTIVVNESFF